MTSQVWEILHADIRRQVSLAVRRALRDPRACIRTTVSPQVRFGSMEFKTHFTSPQITRSVLHRKAWSLSIL